MGFFFVVHAGVGGEPAAGGIWHNYFVWLLYFFIVFHKLIESLTAKDAEKALSSLSFFSLHSLKLILIIY